MRDSVSAIVGFCHSRIVKVCFREFRPSRAGTADFAFTNPDPGFPALPSNVVADYDNFKSYFPTGNIRFAYRHGLAQAAPLSRIPGRDASFRSRGRGMRGQPASAQYADQGARGRAQAEPG